MKIKAIKTKRIKPKYPTMDLFVNNPQLLSKSIPEKWLGNSLVYGSLTAFILCGNAEKAYSQLPETSIVLNNENDLHKTFCGSSMILHNFIYKTKVSLI